LFIERWVDDKLVCAEVLEILITNGAELNAFDKNDLTPLDYAANEEIII